jgi:hypothetical protein
LFLEAETQLTLQKSLALFFVWLIFDLLHPIDNMFMDCTSEEKRKAVEEAMRRSIVFFAMETMKFVYKEERTSLVNVDSMGTVHFCRVIPC